MTSTVESRLVPRIAMAVIVLAALAVGLWRWGHHSETAKAVTSTAMTPEPAAVVAGAVRSPGSVEGASLTITVSDERGSLAGATVRLVSTSSDVVVVEAGIDGIARAGELEPGMWTVSASAADHLPAALPAMRLVAGVEEKLTIKLSGGGQLLTGTVSDVMGGPITGVRIDAARADRLALPGPAVSTTFTGVDGTYRLTVGEGSLTVVATSADYAPQSHYVEVGPAGAVADFSLVPGGVIEGIVRDERTKAPVAGARVFARRDRPAMLFAASGAYRVTAGSDGRFRIRGLSPGAWDLSATGEERTSKAQTVVGLGVAEQVTDVELLIGRGPVIRGLVVSETGAPVPHVEVQALARSGGATGIANAKGSFTLVGLNPGDYTIHASNEMYLPEPGTHVTLGDNDVDAVVVTVKRGYRLKGHVVPAQECTVQQDPDLGAGPMMILAPGTTTSADGEFTLGPLAGGAVRLTARCASGNQGSTQVTLAGGMPDTVIHVAPGASISGRVVDGEGKPVAGIGVVASEISSGERTMMMNGMITSGVQGLSNGDGAYRLDGLTVGAYALRVVERGKPLHQRGPQPRVTLGANEQKTGVDLTVDRPNGIIQGTVTGPDGHPLVDAWVSVHQNMKSMLDSMRGDSGAQDSSEPRTITFQGTDIVSGDSDGSFSPALTDARGHYEIRGLSDAIYTVTAEAQRGQLRGQVEGVKPDATANIRALGVTSLTGTVTGPDGPSSLFSVELDGPTRAQRSFTNGTFSFGRVDPGTYAVRVQGKDGNGQANVEVPQNAPATVDVQLVRNAIVVGRLVDATNQPIVGQAVALVGESNRGAQLQIGEPSVTEADGSFRFDHRAETVMLIVMRQPRPFTKRGIVLEAGKRLDLGAITIDAPGPGSGSLPPP